MKSPSNKTAPLIIGGMGGSGTRVYMAIAQAAGYSMLATPAPVRPWTKEDHDNLLLMRLFYTKWATKYLCGELGRVGSLRMRAACRWWLWLSGPLSYGRGRWGWKNPRTMLLIPFFHGMYPNMRYLHVMRDGRDHAFHPRFEYVTHREGLMSEEECRLDAPLRKALYWSRAHQLTASDAQTHLGGNFMQSRLEDLCGDPANETRRIMNFLGVDDPGVISQAAKLVSTPRSLGRWKTEPPEQIARVEQLIGEDLLRHGYAPSQPDSDARSIDPTGSMPKE